MLTAVPMSWFSWNFRLREPGGASIGEVKLSAWRERGAVELAGKSYRIRRDGLLGPFLMEASDGAVVAMATKPSALRSEFVVSDDVHTYELKAVSMFQRTFHVYRDDERLGAIVPDSFLGRQASLQFPGDTPPLMMQAFLAWLTLLLWKRAAAASSG
jgi:hypothetical protein